MVTHFSFHRNFDRDSIGFHFLLWLAAQKWYSIIVNILPVPIIPWKLSLFVYTWGYIGLSLFLLIIDHNKINNIINLFQMKYGGNPSVLRISCTYVLIYSVWWAWNSPILVQILYTNILSEIKLASVSDLLDYINPNQDVKGRDAAAKRRNNFTKVN